MSNTVDITEFEKASSGSLIRLSKLADNAHAFFVEFDQLIICTHALAVRAPLHVSGHSGTGKSHFLNTLLFGSGHDFTKISKTLGLPQWQGIKCHRIFVSGFETPAEIFYRTEVVNFTTEERPQRILEILEEATNDLQTLHVVWLVESGRGSTASVQGGFLEVVGQHIVREPRGQTFGTSNVAFVTDSNYAANESGDFVIWDLDQAYARRWTRRMTFSGLTPEQESMVLRELSPEATDQQITQVVALATAIRQRQEEGGLLSVLPPTLDVERDLLECMRCLPTSARPLVFGTLLGHCSPKDLDEAETAFAEAFGVRVNANTPAAQAVGAL